MNTLNFSLTNHPKVIETGLGFIIMGQYYTKGDLKPVSVEGASILGGDNVLNLNSVCYLGTDAREGLRDRMFRITQDSVNKDKYYFMVNTHHANYNQTKTYLCISEEKDNKIDILASISVNNIEWYQLVSQDNEFIYVTFKSLSGHASGLYKINKLTYEATQVISHASTTRAIPDLVDVNDTYIYLCIRNVNCTMYLYRYNKSTGQVESKTRNASQDVTFYSVSPTVQYAGRVGYNVYRNYVTPITHEKLFPQQALIRHDNVYTNGTKKVLHFPQRYNEKFFVANNTVGLITGGRPFGSSGNRSTGIEDEDSTITSIAWHVADNNYASLNWTINTTASQRNHGSFVIDTSLADFANGNNINYALGNNYGNSNFRRMTSLDVNYNTCRYWVIDNKYLCLIQYEESNTQNTHVNYQGILVCEITSNSNLTPISLDRISSTKEIISMCYNSDMKTLMIGFKNEFLLYVWDNANHYYIRLGEEITGVSSAGFDSLDRIWYQKTDGAVHIMDIEEPQTIDIEFEKESYYYSGVPIETYVTFSIKNFRNDYATGTYYMELIGSAVFKSNEKNTCYYNYQGGTVQVPVIIIGSDNVSCKISCSSM